jgi:hypothetical protein
LIKGGYLTSQSSLTHPFINLCVMSWPRTPYWCLIWSSWCIIASRLIHENLRILEFSNAA